MHTVDAQTWSYATEQTETKSKLRGRDRGGNSLSAKQCSAGMYSRLFAHVTWLATDQRAVGHRWRGPERCGGGGGERDLLRKRDRWVEDKMSHTYQRSFLMFAQFWFMRDRVDVGVDCWETYVCLEETFQKMLVGFRKVFLPLLEQMKLCGSLPPLPMWLSGLSGFVAQKQYSSCLLTDFC